MVTAETADTLYLRGIEEACHHSLVLRKGAAAECSRIGLRVLTEADLDRAFDWLSAGGRAPRWVEVAHQGRACITSRS